MKRVFRVTCIAIGTLMALVAAAACVVCWLVFTPARLTDIVNKAADKYLTCDMSVGEIDLALFSTFPNVSLQLSDVVLVNPVEGTPNDTVATIEHGLAVLDIDALLNERIVVLRRLQLDGGWINLYTDANGIANYMIFSADTLTEESANEKSFDIPNVDLEEIGIQNIHVDYHDAFAGQKVAIDGLSLNVNGHLFDKHLQATLRTSLHKVMLDVEGKDVMNVCVEDITLGANGKIGDNKMTVNLTFGVGSLDALIADMMAHVEQIEWIFDGSGTDGLWNGATTLSTQPIQVRTEGENSIDADLIRLTLNADARQMGKDIILNSTVTLPGLTVDLREEKMLNDVNLKMRGTLLTDTILSHMKLKEGLLSFNEQEVALSGDVERPDTSTLIADMDFETNRWDFTQLLALVPDCHQYLLDGVEVHGGMKLKGRGKGTLVGSEACIEDMEASLSLDNIDMSYNDSIALDSHRAYVDMKYNGHKDNVEGCFSSEVLHVSMSGLADAQLHEVESNFTLNQAMRVADGYADANASVFIEQLSTTIDTLQLYTQGASIDIAMNGDKGKNPQIDAVLHLDSMHTEMGTLVVASTSKINAKAHAAYDELATNLLAQWNPQLSLDIHAGDVASPMLTVPVIIPHIQFDYAEGHFTINDSRILLGNSDFSLQGDVHNIDSFINKTGLLKAELDFSSSYTDVTQLMNLVSGLGCTDTTDVEKNIADSDDTTEENPFMVPLGVDVKLNTDIRTVNVNGFDFDDIGGYVAVKDGVLVLEEMGFSSDAARMQLTAMYKSPRKNHLFVGFDFHLLDVEIDELIHMVPDVDSIIPMLSAFDGEAEFHFAAETYLKSNYDIKKSTLRAAGAIEGKNLVVMDNETFAQISKYLMFEKETKNIVDSISVELTVFKDEVDLYPFLIFMDDYKAVIGGRHNINENLDFNYHISLLSPLRLGLDINGSLDDMRFKPVACKYADMYNPKRQDVVQARTLHLKKIISESLKDNVKPHTPCD